MMETVDSLDHFCSGQITACVPTFSKGEDDERDLEKLEEKVWDPSSSLTEKQIDQFLVVARYVRAVACTGFHTVAGGT